MRRSSVVLHYITLHHIAWDSLDQEFAQWVTTNVHSCTLYLYSILLHNFQLHTHTHTHTSLHNTFIPGQSAHSCNATSLSLSLDFLQHTFPILHARLLVLTHFLLFPFSFLLVMFHGNAMLVFMSPSFHFPSFPLYFLSSPITLHYPSPFYNTNTGNEQGRASLCFSFPFHTLTSTFTFSHSQLSTMYSQSSTG